MVSGSGRAARDPGCPRGRLGVGWRRMVAGVRCGPLGNRACPLTAGGVVRARPTCHQPPLPPRQSPLCPPGQYSWGARSLTLNASWLRPKGRAMGPAWPWGGVRWPCHRQSLPCLAILGGLWGGLGPLPQLSDSGEWASLLSSPIPMPTPGLLGLDARPWG